MFRNLVIIVAIFGLGWGASFGAGVAFGRRTAPTAQAAAPTGAGGPQLVVQGGQGGASGQGGQGGQAAGAGGAGGTQTRLTAGTIQSVQGQTLTLAGPNNQPQRVTLTPQTQITKQVDGTPADLTAGTTVTVQPQGQPAADGTVTAATIVIGAPGGPARQLIQGGPGGPGGQQRPGG